MPETKTYTRFVLKHGHAEIGQAEFVDPQKMKYRAFRVWCPDCLTRLTCHLAIDCKRYTYQTHDNRQIHAAIGTCDMCGLVAILLE
jgi:hypothetical protein